MRRYTLTLRSGVEHVDADGYRSVNDVIMFDRTDEAGFLLVPTSEVLRVELEAPTA